MLASLFGISGCESLASTLPPGCTKSTAIAVGDTVTTSFGTNSCTEPNGTYVDFYNLALTSQANLVVSVRSPGLATYVVVYNQLRTGVVNSSVTNVPDTMTSARMMLGPASYQISVRDTLGMAGTYRLSVTADTAPVAGCGLIWITAGITTTQHLTNSDCTQGSGAAIHYYHHYELVMTFQQSNTVTEQSTAFNPSTALYTSLFGLAGSSTLDSTGTVATLRAFAEAQDYYQLWVGTTNALQTGTYTLTVN